MHTLVLGKAFTGINAFWSSAMPIWAASSAPRVSEAWVSGRDITTVPRFAPAE